MTTSDPTSIAPLFIVRSVPAALTFYRDRLGFADFVTDMRTSVC